MVIATQAAYTAAKAALESIGFTNLPDVSAIDFTSPIPAVLTGNLQYNHATVESLSVSLRP